MVVPAIPSTGCIFSDPRARHLGAFIKAQGPFAVFMNGPDHDRWFVQEVLVHEAELRAWMRKGFPSVHDVDDLVQEAMTRVWEARTARGVESPRAFLFASARNLAIDRMRRQQVVSTEPVSSWVETEGDSGVANPAEAAAHHQELELLTEAIQALPSRCRQVLTLRKVYGLTQKQIAQKLGISEHTVEAQVANGMRRCAQFLSRLGLP